MNELKTTLNSLILKNPIILASGTCGYGIELQNFFDLSKIGAITLKATTLNRKEGNKTPRIAELIKENRDDEVKDALEEGYNIYGTQSFDLSLVDLVMQGKITEEEALENASSPDDLALKIKKAKMAENAKNNVQEEDEVIGLKID